MNPKGASHEFYQNLPKCSRLASGMTTKISAVFESEPDYKGESWLEHVGLIVVVPNGDFADSGMEGVISIFYELNQEIWSLAI